MATTPVRWIWATSAKASNRYPIVVLNYHRVSDTSPGEKTIATADFSRQLEWLSKNFDMVSLQEVQKRINGGIDRPTAAITFDGGHVYDDGDTPTEVQGNMTFEVVFEDPAGNVGAIVDAVTRQTASLGWVTQMAMSSAKRTISMCGSLRQGQSPK